MCSRVCHLQFFWISLLFQAGTSVCHTQEQKKYRSSMFYVGIFQLFLTFVLYKHKLVAKKSGFLLNWSKIVQQYDRSDVVTQQIQVKNLLTVYLLIIIMFYTDFVCTMNFLHHRGGGVNCILTAPIKVPWCELLGLFLKK